MCVAFVDKYRIDLLEIAYCSVAIAFVPIRFDSFIPVSAVDLTTEPAILDSLMKTFAIPHEKKSAITIVFLWNNIFKNLSVEAFHVIVDNMAKAKEADTCSIILVNTDKPYIKLLNQTEN